MKKVLMVALSIFLCLCSCSALAENNNKTEEQNVELLEKMGIYIEEDNMNQSDEFLTREKMVAILSAFYGVERDGKIKEFSGESIYTDIDKDYYLAYEIMLLAEKGCMSGFTDNTFRPKSYVTYPQALKAVVCVLGYGEMAEYQGGWAEGYIKKAEETGITDGITVGVDEYITNGDFTDIIVNALEAETVKINIKNAGEAEYTEGEKLLNKMGYYKAKGILTATENVSLFGHENAGKNKIVVDNTLIECNENYDDYIGMNVVAYYKQDKTMDMGEVCYIALTNKNKIVMVEDEKISDRTTSSEFIFENEKGREEKVILKNNISFIFNGRKMTFFEKEHIKPENGFVKLVDADSDGDYETIIVKSYIDIWVSNVYENNGTVTISDNITGKNIVLDMNDSNIDLNIIKNGEKAGYKDIKVKNIVSVAADQMSVNPLNIEKISTCYDIIISDSSNEGVLKGIDKEERKIKLNDNEYEVGMGFDFSGANLLNGKNYIAYFNYKGEVSAMKETSLDKYGFLIKVYADENDDEKMIAKIFSHDGTFIKVYLAKNAKIDGKQLKDFSIVSLSLENSSSEFFANLDFSMKNRSGMEQLIKYRVNADGEIVYIDTLSKNSDNIEGLQFGVKLTAPMHAFDGIFEGGIALDSSAVTFMLPGDVQDEMGYGVLIDGRISSDTINHDIYTYDLDELNVTSACVANAGVNEKVAVKETNNMMVVAKVENGVDSENLPIKIISGTKISSGVQFELEVEEDVLNADSVKPGTIIRWTENSRGQAEIIEITFSPEGEESYLKTNNHVTSFYSDFRIGAGVVENIDDEHIMIEYERTDGSVFKETYRLNKLSRVLVYDKNSKNKVSTADLSAIRTRKWFGNDASIVFTLQNYARPTVIVVYK